MILVYVIFTAIPLQIFLQERTRTQAHTEEVEMKKAVQTQCPYYGNLHCGNGYIYS